jgi:hypothetical protein
MHFSSTAPGTPSLLYFVSNKPLIGDVFPLPNAQRFQQQSPAVVLVMMGETTPLGSHGVYWGSFRGLELNTINPFVAQLLFSNSPHRLQRVAVAC